MSVAGRLTAFTIASLLALGAGAAVGTAVGPIDAPGSERPPRHEPTTMPADHMPHPAGMHP